MKVLKRKRFDRIKKKLIILLMISAVSALCLTPSYAAPYTGPSYNPEWQWGLKMIHADLAYRTNMQGQGVRIAVIDSGVSEHSELGTVTEGFNYLNGSTDVSDSYGHGTFISGILSAQGEKILGVAPKAQIIPLKCFDEKLTSTEFVSSAVRDAVDKYHCDIINLSFGMTADSELMRSAVAYAVSKGAVLVAAAGNDGTSEKFYPASYDGVISVSSIDADGQLSDKAQQNDSITLTAPGVDIYSTSSSGGYGIGSGSSFAAPYAAGAAAVLLSMDDSLKASRIKDILAGTASDAGYPGYDVCYGYGILNLEAAMKEVMKGKKCWISPVEEENGSLSCVVYNSSGSDGRFRFVMEDQAEYFSLDSGCSEKLSSDKTDGYLQSAVYEDDITDDSGALKRARCISNIRYFSCGNYEKADKFTDISRNSWYFDEVSVAVSRKLMNGMSLNEFAPGGNVSRAMMVSVLYRMQGQPEYTGECAFNDVESGRWYTDAVVWASGNGIVNGMSPDEFAPYDDVTREQMAAMLYRYDRFCGYDVSVMSDGLSAYEDCSLIDRWAYDSMNYCVDRGILNGVTPVALNPLGCLTRAELAAVLSRL